MNFFVFGYFGRHNLGDEAILESFLTWSRSRLPGCNYRVLSASPAQTSERYGVEPVAKKDFLSIFKSVLWADAVVAPGGGVFQDITSARSVIFYMAILAIAGIWGRPVFLLSQGMGPFKRGWVRTLVRRAFERWVDRVWVRDEAALAHLKEIGLKGQKYELGADMVLGLSEYPGPVPVAAHAASGAPLRVAVSLRPCEGLDRMTGVLEGCLLRIKKSRSIELTLFAFDNEQDVPVINRFAEEMRRSTPELPVRIFGSSRKSQPKIQDAFEAFRGMDIVLGMRLHSLVFAAMGGVPFVGLCYDPKVKAFAEACGQPMIEEIPEASPLALDHAIAELIGDKAPQARLALRDTAGKLRGRLAESLNIFEREIRAIEERAFDVLGIPVSGMSLERTLDKIAGSARGRRKLHVVTLNPEMALRAGREPEFRKVLTSGALNTTDGVGIRIAVRLKYGRRLEAVTGIDLSEKLLERSAASGLRIFLLGGRPEVIDRCAELLRERTAPPLTAGCHHGYLSGVDPQQLRKTISEAKPDIILAGMGVPLQEYWIRDNINMLEAPVFIGVGGTFDVWAGASKRAPGIFRKTGLEWLYRAVSDPSRLGRIAGFPIFLLKIILDAFLWRSGITKKLKG